MKDQFKVSEKWISYLIVLWDEEAWRLAKAIWVYASSKVEPTFAGKLDDFWSLNNIAAAKMVKSKHMREAAKSRRSKLKGEPVSKPVKQQLSPEHMAIKIADEVINDEMWRRAAKWEDTYISNDEYHKLTWHSMDERREMLSKM